MSGEEWRKPALGQGVRKSPGRKGADGEWAGGVTGGQACGAGSRACRGPKVQVYLVKRHSVSEGTSRGGALKIKLEGSVGLRHIPRSGRLILVL